MDLDSLNTPISYENRIICFFDIMGWKNHIENAGIDPKKIGKLAFLPKILTSTLVKNLSQTEPGKLTSFSDCNIVSIDYHPEYLPQILYGLSRIFIGAALNGFFLRAGVTIGDIHHTKDLVFGPGLNRAYELEGKGKYPRIILDPEILDLRDLELNFDQEDDDILFLDPFNINFLQRPQMLQAITEAFPGSPKPALTCLTVIQEALLQALTEAGDERAKSKLNWLYTRVRTQLKNIMQ